MTASYIYNETLVGDIDGINTVFTTTNEIGKVEEVYLGGVAYRSLTFTGNSVIFADAPTIGMSQPTIDYFPSVGGLSPFGDVLFGDIIDDTYNKIGAKRTSNVYLESQVKRQINKGFKRIKNIKAYRDVVLQYTFNKAEDSYAIGYDAANITISVPTNDYIPSTGALLLGKSGALVTYNTYLNGVFNTAAGFVYDSGDRVLVGYRLPTGAKRPSEIISDGQVLIYSDTREFVINPSNYNYTLITDGTGATYLFMPFQAQDIQITVKFIPEYDIFDADDDVVNIMYDYCDTLSLYAAYNVLLLREDDRWQAIKQEYKEMLADMKAYLSKAVDGINNKFKSTPLVNPQQIVRRSTFK